MTTALHSECVCCLAVSHELGPEEATLATLSALSNFPVTVVQFVRDLCFYHRRMLRDMGNRLREELAATRGGIREQEE